MKNIKGKVLVGLASTAMLGGVVLGSVQTFAANEPLDTRVYVGFGDGHQGGGDTTGELGLNYVPGRIDFGTGHVAGETVSQAGTITPSEAYVALSDDRPGDRTATPLDWKLVASASQLVDSTGTKVINSGNITIGFDGTHQWNVTLEPAPGLPQLRPEPSATTVTETSGGLATVDTESSAVLTLDGTPQDVAKMRDSERKGYAVKLESAQLNIAAAGTNQVDHASTAFSGDITWTLTNTID